MQKVYDSAKKASERAEQIRRARKPGDLVFGVPYLDSALDGISDSDLVVLGAPTGAGKTELATHIAASNTRNKRHVLFFALESEETEIVQRIKFKIYSAIYRSIEDYRKPFFGGVLVNSRNYLNNKIPISEIDDKTDLKFEQDCETLTLVERYFEFTVDDLATIMDKFKDQFDLVIIDHLNYFDLDESKNENRAVGDVVKRIRDLALYHRKPTLLIAHLRKSDSRSKVLIPTAEDIHGTSNIIKIATKIIVMTPDNKSEFRPGVYPTFFRIAKYRRDGSVTRYVASCDFLQDRNAYDSNYKIGILNYDQTEFEEITDSSRLPSWARPSQVGF